MPGDPEEHPIEFKYPWKFLHKILGSFARMLNDEVASQFNRAARLTRLVQSQERLPDFVEFRHS